MAIGVFGAALLLGVSGVYLSFVPVSPGASGALKINPGNWTEVSVPSAAFPTGLWVYVTLAWGATQGCGGADCPTCWNCSVEYNLTVFDCGPASCLSGHDYSPVGATYPTPGQGVVDFAATPGHHYMVWVWGLSSPPKPPGSLPPVPLSWTVVVPVADGLVGLTMVAAAASVAIHWVRKHGWPRFSHRP